MCQETEKERREFREHEMRAHEMKAVAGGLEVHTEHYTLYTAHYTLHTEHCTLNSTHCTLNCLPGPCPNGDCSLPDPERPPATPLA